MRVTGLPQSARVFFDGQDRTTAALAGLLDRVPTGPHAVQVNVDGMLPSTTYVVVKGGETATVQPVLEELSPDFEEAAATLGATPWQIFRRVVLPAITPAYLTGLSLAFARCLGEFGAVIFIAGNLPMKTEIAALLIFIRLEEYDYTAAAAIATVLLAAAFLLLLTVNAIQAWQLRYADRGR